MRASGLAEAHGVDKGQARRRADGQLATPMHMDVRM
jgi:hypothetical protein